MKKKYASLLLLFISLSIFSQTPDKIAYQAVVRSADGNIVSNASIGLKISILKESNSGEVVYAETFTPTTNENGLFTIEIGTGTVNSGEFSSINWSSDTYFIKSEIDIEGGSNYTITGTSQLLSVPYALHAKRAENVPNFKIGDFAHGGIVVWVDETGQHGLVCAKENQSASVRWFAGTFGVTNAKGDGIYAGRSNTTIVSVANIILGDDGNNNAIKLCNELEVVENNILYGDWYLPSAFELKLISQSLAIINATAQANGGDALVSNFYWSSTEENNNNAKIVNLANGQENIVLKSSQNLVRAVRKF